jgi:hypothetical protein
MRKILLLDTAAHCQMLRNGQITRFGFVRSEYNLAEGLTEQLVLDQVAEMTALLDEEFWPTSLKNTFRAKAQSEARVLVPKFLFCLIDALQSKAMAVSKTSLNPTSMNRIAAVLAEPRARPFRVY